MYMWSHIEHYQCNRSQSSSSLCLFTALDHSFDDWRNYLIDFDDWCNYLIDFHDWRNYLIDFDDFFLIQLFNFIFDLFLNLNNLLFHAFSLDVTVVKLNNGFKDSSWDVQDAINDFLLFLSCCADLVQKLSWLVWDPVVQLDSFCLSDFQRFLHVASQLVRSLDGAIDEITHCEVRDLFYLRKDVVVRAFLDIDLIYADEAEDEESDQNSSASNIFDRIKPWGLLLNIIVITSSL